MHFSICLWLPTKDEKLNTGGDERAMSLGSYLNCHKIRQVFNVARIAKEGEERETVRAALEHAKKCCNCKVYVVQKLRFKSVEALENYLELEWIDADKTIKGANNK